MTLLPDSLLDFSGRFAFLPERTFNRATTIRRRRHRRGAVAAYGILTTLEFAVIISHYSLCG